MKQNEFEDLALAVIREIPYGKVASYGTIADKMGAPNYSRHVGKACRHSQFYDFAPCHRVVNHAGKLTANWDEQKSLLVEEGVEFLENGCVDMKKFEWK